MRFFTYFLVVVFSFCCLQIEAQNTSSKFGKNRVQYHDDFDEWMQYESLNFITYWYGKGRNIGQATVMMAEQDYDAIQNILEHRINDKIEIIVYTDVTDLKQSNIGSEEAFINTGGQTKIVENKIFIYFDGNHNNLRKQIREGVASVYLNAMLFGSNLQEIVQNAVMMNLPKWFKEGLVAFVGEEWNTDLDNQLKDLFLSNKDLDFDELAEEHPKLAGHSLWYFINQNYGKSTVSNLLYLTRINRSIDSGFLYVLGTPYQKTINSWAIYYRQRYEEEAQQMDDFLDTDKIEVKNKRNLPLSQLSLSPDGQKLAYVANEIGKYKVFVKDLQTGKTEVVLKGGFRNAFQATDYGYPLVSWSPSGFELGVIYEKRDIVKLLLYDINAKQGKTEPIPELYQRIYSMDYLDNNSLVLSGTVNGYSDIFIFKTGTRQSERLTSDFYDDLDARVVNVKGKKGILFASNRQDSLIYQQKLDSILPINTFDLYYYDLEKKSKELVRVTNTPLANERQPIGIDSTYFSYLSDESGTYNRQLGYLETILAYHEQVITLKGGQEIVLHQDSSLASLDSTAIDTTILRPVYKDIAYTYNNSNYKRNIITQHASLKTNKVVELVYKNGGHQFYIREIDVDKKINPKLTRFMEQKNASISNVKSSIEEENAINNVLIEVDETPIDVSDIPEDKEDEGSIDIDNYSFQSEFDGEETPEAVIVEEDNGEVLLQRPPTIVDNTPAIQPANSVNQKFRPSRIIPYRLKFKTDYVTTQLDNNLLFDGLDSYLRANNDGTQSVASDLFYYPPPGILVKGNFKDLFEDYIFEGGVRVPTTFNGAEYFLIFDNKKKRLDKRFAFYRRGLRFNQESISSLPRRTREVITMGQFTVKYPFDIFKSLRATATVRGDRLVQLATDVQALNTPTQRNQRVGLKLEYVFDNTLDVALNIKNGTRYKIYAEFLKRFEIQLVDEKSFNFGQGFMGVIGLDGRHYQRLDKHSILAFRMAAASSFGSEHILFYLGGVDSWLFPSFNDDIPFPNNNDFAYQTLASNMRGFRLNIRNGSSFALMNTELRVPIFKYFSRRIRSSFFRNFQLVSFFDVGTAWEGATPFSDENPLNTSIISPPAGSPQTITVKVNYFRDPIVAGYGFGIRSMLFGYFVRLDYAWGIETRVKQDPVLYLSIGMDF